MENIILWNIKPQLVFLMYNVDAQTPSWSAETDKYDRLHPVFVYLSFKQLN